MSTGAILTDGNYASWWMLGRSLSGTWLAILSITPAYAKAIILPHELRCINGGKAHAMNQCLDSYRHYRGLLECRKREI